jgi:hypothetical protein
MVQQSTASRLRRRFAAGYPPSTAFGAFTPPR